MFCFEDFCNFKCFRSRVWIITSATFELKVYIIFFIVKLLVDANNKLIITMMVIIIFSFLELRSWETKWMAVWKVLIGDRKICRHQILEKNKSFTSTEKKLIFLKNISNFEMPSLHHLHDLFFCSFFLLFIIVDRKLLTVKIIRHTIQLKNTNVCMNNKHGDKES